MPQKAVKGQASTDFLADHPVSGILKLYNDLPDEIVEVNLINTSSEEQVWHLFFDGASRTNPEENIIAGVGVVLISPHNYVIPRAFSLTELCSNNISEYNALLIGMLLAEEIGVKNLEAYGDSKLIVNWVRGEYEVRYEHLVPYHNATIIMAEKIENFYIDHIPRQQNAHADALVSLATSLTLLAGATERVIIYSHDLYCCKFALEDSKTPRGDLQVKKVLETLTSLEPSD